MASNGEAAEGGKPATLPRQQPVEPPVFAPARIDRDVVRAEMAEIIRRRRRLNGPGGENDAPPEDDSDVDAEDRRRDDLAIERLREVRDRYRAPDDEDGGDGKDKADAPPPTVVPEVCGLVGLALSGGGIRSASFCLGVLQALAAAGKLRFVDYLSTVSGGGYAGSSWSALLARSDDRDVESRPDFPFVHVRAGEPEDRRGRKPCVEEERRRQGQEPVALVHVRDFANYLMPRGLRDQVLVPALLLRGLIVNLIIILPFPLLLAAATLLLHGAQIRRATTGGDLYLDLVLTPWALAACLAYAVAVTAYQARRWPLPALPWPSWAADRTAWAGRLLLLEIGSRLFLSLALVALLEVQPLAISFLAVEGAGPGRLLDPDLWGAIGTAAGLASALFAGQAVNASSDLTRKVAFALVGVLGPLALWLLYLYLCRWAVLYPFPPSEAAGIPFGWIAAYVLLAVAALAYGRFFVDINRTSLHGYYRDRLSRAFMIRIQPERSAGATGPLAARWCVEHQDEVRLSELRPGRSGGPYHLINATVNNPGFGAEAERRRLGSERQRGRRADFFVFSPRYCGNERLGYCTTRALEEVDPHLNLATAMAISAAAAAPNMGQKTFSPVVVFLMALLNVRLGYWLQSPDTLQDGPPAARPGREPPTGAAGPPRRKPTERVGPIYYLRELIGIPPKGYPYVNLSDGGHLDNLGLFELLRRRCRYIVAIDAEADPGMTFNGLAVVQRFACVDLGVRIDFDIEDLRTGPDGRSRRHWMLGRIDYGDGQLGELLYIKASVTGSEAEYVKEYRARNPAFPHETTGDQFFDEAQFEAYRRLGHKVGEELVRDRYARSRIELRALHDRRDAPAETADAFFDGLREWLRPAAPFGDAFLALHEGRRAVDARLHDGAIAGYAADLFPELGLDRRGPATEPKAAPASRPRAGLSDDAAAYEAEALRRHGSAAAADGAADEASGGELRLLRLVNDQMRLMEAALLALQLDEPASQHHPRNRGLMNLFRRWAEAATFRRYWAVSIPGYSDSLQVFGKYALGLDFEPCWRNAVGRDLTPAERRLLKDAVGAVPEHAGEDLPPTPLRGVVQGWVASPPGRGGDHGGDALAFPVAVARVDADADRRTVSAFRVRDTYRDLRLDELLLRRLRDDLRDQCGRTPSFLVDPRDTSPAAAYLRDLAARLGFDMAAS